MKDEIRRNLLRALEKAETLFPGVHGYEDTVVPQIVNALLSRHNFILLGLRGQAKSRILRGLINLLDPDMIVMGGGASRIPRIYKNVPKRLEEYVFGKEADTPMSPAKHGDSSGVRGAAWLWPLE